MQPVLYKQLANSTTSSLLFLHQFFCKYAPANWAHMNAQFDNKYEGQIKNQTLNLCLHVWV